MAVLAQTSTPGFGGTFGHLTSVMAGLYLIGFAAPAFEAAATAASSAASDWAQAESRGRLPLAQDQ